MSYVPAAFPLPAATIITTNQIFTHSLLSPHSFLLWQGYEIVLRTLHVARSLDFLSRSIDRESEKNITIIEKRRQSAKGRLLACLLAAARRFPSPTTTPLKRLDPPKIIIIIIMIIMIMIIIIARFFFLFVLEFCLGALVRHRKVPKWGESGFSGRGDVMQGFREAKNAADDIEEDLETGR